jgi:2-polyprenyl-3-methyl-5-hydroxy-6-metoxy-1,4-benzoquinol methylase
MRSILPQEVLSCLEGHVASLCERRLEVGELTLFSGQLLQEREWQLADIFEQIGIKRTPITEHSWDSHSGLYIHASKQWEYLFALKELEKFFPEGMEQLRIADVGGGRGALPAYLAKLGHQVDVYDINYLWDSRGDQGLEKRYMRWARTNGYTARFGSVHNLPSGDEAYDVVTSISVVEHVPHKVFAVKEALRILRPGGLLILTFDFAPHPEKFKDSLRVEIFGPELLAATLAALGLQLSAVNPEAIQKSASDIQSEKVLGIPVGMTVGGLIIRKLAATKS